MDRSWGAIHESLRGQRHQYTMLFGRTQRTGMFLRIPVLWSATYIDPITSLKLTPLEPG